MQKPHQNDPLTAAVDYAHTDAGGTPKLGPEADFRYLDEEEGGPSQSKHKTEPNGKAGGNDKSTASTQVNGVLPVIKVSSRQLRDVFRECLELEFTRYRRVLGQALPTERFGDRFAYDLTCCRDVSLEVQEEEEAFVQHGLAGETGGGGSFLWPRRRRRSEFLGCFSARALDPSSRKRQSDDVAHGSRSG
jgi:hypothetical protein